MADGGDEHALLLQISYDLARLQKQTASAQGIVNSGLTGMEARAKRAAQELENSLSLKNVNVGASLTSALSGLKTGVLDQASARLGVFGGALGALGPIGLAAGAGVAALGFAISNSLKTAEWAEDLKRASSTLGLTTTQLQEFDFVFNAMGIDVGRGRETLAGLEKTIGLVESGLARSMQVKAFTEALKITPEQLRGWGTLENQIPHILDALAKLDPEERAAVASRLRVDPEVINSMVEERDRIRDLITEMRSYGIVLDEATINKSAEAEGKIRALSAVVNGELRVAFVELAPVLVGVAKGFADGANYLASFLKGVEDLLTPIGKLIGLLQQMGVLAKGNAGFTLASVLGPAGVPFDLLAAQGARDRRAAALQPTVTRDDMLGLVNATHPKPFGSGTGHKRKGPEDRSDDAIDEAESKLLEATKAELEARLAGTTDAKAKAALEGEILGIENKIRDAEFAKLRADLDEQLVKKEITKAAHDKATALLISAQLAQGAADAEKQIAEQQAAAQKAAEKKLADQNSLADLRAQGQLDLLHAEQGVFQTTEDRRKLALQIFATEEQIAEDKLNQQIAEAQLAKDAAKEAEARQQLANLQATRGLREQAVSNANPGNAWDAWVSSAQQSTRDVSQSFAQMKVDAIDAFNNSLFDSEGRLQSFGAIARSVARTFITDFEKFSVKSIEAGIFGGSEGQGGNPLTNFFGGLFGRKSGGQAGAANQATSALAPFTNAVELATQALQRMATTSSLGGGGGLGGLGGLFGGGSGGGQAGDLLSSVFGGDGGVGGWEAASGFTDFVPFASGGQFTVGGRGGIDKNLVAFRATAGERVSVETPQQQLNGSGFGGRNVSQTFNFPGADPDSFKKTQRQWARESKMRMQFA